MDFNIYLADIGYPTKLYTEVLDNPSKYVYNFKFKGKWQIAPKWELKILQKILKDYLTEHYAKENISTNATAYIKGKNLSFNVERHQGNSYFFVTDFNNFFPSISKNNVIDKLDIILSEEPEEIKNDIYKIIFFKDKLQYGFPTSPLISNIIMNEFDTVFFTNLSKEFEDNNIQYSRYSDDITISTKYKITKYKVLKILKNVIEGNYSYLSINKRKTRAFEKYAHRPHITGLIPLSKRNSIGKKKFNQIKVNIHLLLNNTLITNTQHFIKISSLCSYLSYLYLVDKHNYFRLKSSFHIKYKNNKNFDLLFSK